MSFATLVSTYGYWMAVRIALTFLGVDFATAVDDSPSVAINTPTGRFVVYQNDKGNNEMDVAIRFFGEEETKGAQGIDDTLALRT